MRVYLDAQKLALQLSRVFEQKKLLQDAAASELGVTQGQISRILRGRFKTRNQLVTRLCKYAKLDIDEFRKVKPIRQSLRSDATLALALACKGDVAREKAVIRILRAIQELT